MLTNIMTSVILPTPLQYYMIIYVIYKIKYYTPIILHLNYIDIADNGGQLHYAIM
jgi:hypothetical protein